LHDVAHPNETNTHTHTNNETGTISVGSVFQCGKQKFMAYDV